MEKKPTKLKAHSLKSNTINKFLTGVTKEKEDKLLITKIKLRTSLQIPWTSKE